MKRDRKLFLLLLSAVLVMALVPMIVAAVVLAVFSAVAWILKSRKEEREMALNHELSDEEQR